VTASGVGSTEPAKRGLDPVEGIRRVFAAFGGGDARALFDVIHEDATWVVNGTVPVAQRYEGRARIFDLFRETRRLTDGTYFSELRWALADRENAVAVYRATGRRLGRELDIDQALLIRHRDGRWVEIVAVPTDPPAFERFWA
jgi:ketosteroid isomerase-like protein